MFRGCTTQTVFIVKCTQSNVNRHTHSFWQRPLQTFMFQLLRGVRLRWGWGGWNCLKTFACSLTLATLWPQMFPSLSSTPVDERQRLVSTEYGRESAAIKPMTSSDFGAGVWRRSRQEVAGRWDVFYFFLPAFLDRKSLVLSLSLAITFKMKVRSRSLEMWCWIYASYSRYTGVRCVNECVAALLRLCLFGPELGNNLRSHSSIFRQIAFKQIVMVVADSCNYLTISFTAYAARFTGATITIYIRVCRCYTAARHSSVKLN